MIGLLTKLLLSVFCTNHSPLLYFLSLVCVLSSFLWVLFKVFVCIYICMRLFLHTWGSLCSPKFLTGLSEHKVLQDMNECWCSLYFTKKWIFIAPLSNSQSNKYYFLCFWRKRRSIRVKRRTTWSFRLFNQLLMIKISTKLSSNNLILITRISKLCNAQIAFGSFGLRYKLGF